MTKIFNHYSEIKQGQQVIIIQLNPNDSYLRSGTWKEHLKGKPVTHQGSGWFKNSKGQGFVFLYGCTYKLYKKPTRRELILKIIKRSNRFLTCGEITKRIIKAEGLTPMQARYLSGSVSTQLARMIKDFTLFYCTEHFGPKNGWCYKLNPSK